MNVAALHLIASGLAITVGPGSPASAECQVVRGTEYLRSGRLAEWVDVVQHAPERDDAALTALASWSSGDLEGVLSALAGLPQMMRDPESTFFTPAPRAGADGGPRRQVLYHPSDAEAFRRAARGLELFPRDAEILFLTGSVRERLADPGVQAVVQSARLPPVPGFDIGSVREELSAPSRCFAVRWRSPLTMPNRACGARAC